MSAPATGEAPSIGSGAMRERAARAGVAYFDGSTFRECTGLDRLPHTEVDAFTRSWDDLHLDRYMADGGRYRRRRHATFTVGPGGGTARPAPHQPHYQDLSFNQLNGGIARHFEPMTPSVVESVPMRGILALGLDIVSSCLPEVAWHVEAHQFRIEAVPEGGKPTPEGVHRDGVDFVLMTLIKRENIRGGSTTIHGADGTVLSTFTLRDPFESVVLDDRRVLHGVGPITAIDSRRPAHRDVLVVTFRRR